MRRSRTGTGLRYPGREEARLRLLKASWPLVRVVLSVVMLAVLVSRLHGRSSGLLAIRRSGSIALVAVACAVTLVGIVLSAVRWQRVLSALELPSHMGILLRHYLAGLFVGNFLPSTIGGDVLRVSRLAADDVDTSASFASVVLERMSGWIVLPVMSLVGLALNPSLFRLVPASKGAVAMCAATLVLLAVVLVLAAHPNLGGRLASREGWLRFMGAVHLGLDRFRRQPWAAVEVITAGFAYQLTIVLAAFIGGHALGLHVGWTAMLAFVPVVAIVQVLPITVSGLGVREGALVLFLGPLGVSTSSAIALGLLLYLMNLVVSLLGAPAFAWGGRSRRAVA